MSDSKQSLPVVRDAKTGEVNPELTAAIRAYWERDGAEEFRKQLHENFQRELRRSWWGEEPTNAAT